MGETLTIIISKKIPIIYFLQLLYKIPRCDYPFLASVSILYPLKTPENQRFSGVFRGYKWKHWPEMGLEVASYLTKGKTF